MKKSRILAFAMGAMMIANTFVPCMASASDGTDSVPEVWYKFDADSVNGTAVSNSGSNTDIGAAELKFGAEVLSSEGTGSLYLAGGARDTDSPHLEMPAGIAANIDGDYTISVMVKDNEGAGYIGWAFSLANGLGTENPFMFIAPYDTGTNFAYDPVGRNSSTMVNANGAEVAASGEWNLLTLVYSAENATLTSYVNGVQNGVSEAVGEEYKLSEIFGAQEEGSANYLGKSAWWVYDPFYNGRIADFRLYSKALSEEELNTLLAEKDAFNESSSVAEEADWVAVAKDKNEISIENAGALTENITLPETGTNGSVITWSSSDEAIIANDGTVIRAAEDTTVILTATITSGEVTESKVIECLVEGTNVNPDRIVDRDYEELDLGDLTAVTKDLVLPTKGTNGADIKWSTSDETVVSDTGVVACDLTKDKTATLKAVVSYGDVKKEKVFDVVVACGLNVWYKFDAEAINESAGEQEVKNLGTDTSIGAAKLDNNAAVLNGAGNGILHLVGGGEEGPRLEMPVGVASALSGDYSISVFVKKDTTDEGPVVSIANAQVGWPPRTPYMQLWMSSDADATPRTEYNIYRTGGGGGRKLLTGAKPETGTWGHLTVTYSAESGVITLYTDGEYQNEMIVEHTDINLGELLTAAARNYLGQDIGGVKTLDGDIADFRIYSRELSEAEIATIAEEKSVYDAIGDDWYTVGDTKATIDLGDLSKVKENLVLPTEGENGETITWATDNAAVITNTGVITKSKDADLNAVLTATVTKGAATGVQAFNVTVKRDVTNTEAAELDAQWLLSYDFEAVKTITDDNVSWQLPTVGGDVESTINWTIKDTEAEGVEIAEGVLTVARDTYSTRNIVLVAEITNGDQTISREFTFSAARNNTVKVYPEADADVRQESPDENFGSSNLTVMFAGDKYYMRFNIPEIPENKVVERIEIKLTHTWGSSDGTFTFLHVADDTWDENVITYNDCPAADEESPILTSDISFNTGNGGGNLRRYFDVTESVIAETDGIYSVCVRTDATNEARGRRICTKEEGGADVYPVLLITVADKPIEPAYSVEVNTENEEPVVSITKLRETGEKDMLVLAVSDADGRVKTVDVQTADEISWTEENAYDVSEAAKTLQEGETLKVFVWAPNMQPWTNAVVITK